MPIQKLDGITRGDWPVRPMVLAATLDRLALHRLPWVASVDQLVDAMQAVQTVHVSEVELHVAVDGRAEVGEKPREHR